MERKSDIRCRVLQNRKALTELQVRELSERICKHIMEQEDFLQAKAIYGYMPIQKEVDIKPVLLQALKMGKKVALPRVEEDSMEFYRILDFSQLETGCFRVMEPKRECPLFQEAGLMLVPLVVFDQWGNRIGYGKGFYDRYIHKNARHVKLAGVGYELQKVPAIPREAFDYPLEYLVTENGWKKRG